MPHMLQIPGVLLTVDKVRNPLRPPRETRSEHPKAVRTWCGMCILTSKRTLRHNGARFFDASIFKGGPSTVCFLHSDFDMSFAPQRRALFRRLNFQKRSVHGVFCSFGFGNARATTARAFSTPQFPKEVRVWCFFYTLTSKCATMGCIFFVSHLACWLRTRRFSESTFRPSGASLEKHSFSTLLPFRAAHGFYFF